ncbi:MAG: molybdopterin molybdenumtransferase MoeA [Bacteroidetes bacterium HGW-Bacteroidetes-4]|jgi:molybdopterin molybdotransferase|nr:MAG: molybdopterin molybdenumtransferase MoeA [Bacteroidetes bacterium HGW-Bacteroidetes-4]
MILFEEALHIVLQKASLAPTESIHFSESAGRVLAADVLSDMDMPPFDKAAMDGFAIRESEINHDLEIIETIAAGQTPQKEISPGTAARIMTGAPVPKGADFVIQVELSETACNNRVAFNGHPKNNIIYQGSDIKTGDVVLHKGQQLDARHIAVLASVGCTQVEVYKKPLVGIISTGDEIVEPSQKPTPSQIRNSNGHQLIAQVADSGAEPHYYGIVKDDYQLTRDAIEKGMNECDVLLLTGGVSMGDFDFVPKIMSDLGIDILFDKVAVQPGKPTTFGVKNNKVVFGLPGNPVSSFIQFDILVKPFIYKTMNADQFELTLKLPLASNYTRKKADRSAYIPVTINNKSQVVPANYHGSAHIFALPQSHGVAVIPRGVFQLKAGDWVDVRLF